MTTPAMAQNEGSDFDPLKDIETLGYANRFGLWDTEFRYDGRIRVPRNVRISKVWYSFQATADNADMSAVFNQRGQGGWDQQYEIIDLSFLEDTDVYTFTLRGDLGGASDQNPRDKGLASLSHPVLVRVVLDDGTARTAVPQVEVLAVGFNSATEASTVIGRPFVRLPYDGVYGLPNAQAGFGLVADDGVVPDNRFIVDLVNPRQGVQNVSGNYSGSVYWQLVHEDGTGAAVSPEPQLLNGLTAHQDSGFDANRKRSVPLDLLKSGDKPGYYRFLVWPQASDGNNGPVSKESWDPDKPEDAFQLGSVYYRYNYATGRSAGSFFLAPGGPPDVDLHRGQQQSGYPGVKVTATSDGRIPRQTVAVTLPSGLRFTEEGNPGYQLTVQGQRIPPKNYPGTVSADGRRLTVKNVDLALSAESDTCAVWVAVTASADAPVGRTSATFQVGDQVEPSTPVNVH